jgi:predicted ester cyclase
MNRRSLFPAAVATAAGCATPSLALTNSKGHGLTAADARTVVEPWYSLFTVKPGRDIDAIFDRTLAPNFQGLIGDGPGEARDRAATRQLLEGLAQLVPDMKFTIKELFASGDRVVVRGEATGTPAGDLFGAPHTGKSFRIMTIDILTVQDRKITRTYHLENWIAALDQLRP